LFCSPVLDRGVGLSFQAMAKLKLFLCLFTFAATALAQPTNQDRAVELKVDEVVKEYMAAYKIPGVSLALLRKGKIVLLKSYGLANVELQVPVKPETIFQSGSIGKQFTAAAIMLLVQDGKLSLDDKISKYIPDVPATWKDITVRNLLNHTSGLGDYPTEIDLRRDYTEDQYFESFKKGPLDFVPGSKWNYSNVGYVTLGILIRKVTGKYYGDFLQERIFKPLNMTTARIISEADIVPNRAAGYRLVRGELKNQAWVSPSTNTTADGSLYLSILDLAKWDAALYTDTPLTQASRKLIWTPAQLSNGTTKGYGFGWHLADVHGHRLVLHGGAWQGFKSQILRFLDSEVTIIFLANSWETRDFKFARALAATVYPEFALPDVKVTAEVDPQVTSLMRGVLMQITTGTVDEKLFTPEALTASRREVIQNTLNALSLPVAVINSSEFIDVKAETNQRVHRFLLTDLGTSLICTIKLTTDNKIASLEITSLSAGQ
jgi:CubicO group peptidase (beta-lactamase class C family)